MITERYETFEIIGQGGMGIVYRAYDRLTRTPVALKAIAALSPRLAPAARDALGTDLNLALSHEFQLLATMRHPHVISVLDYGFGQDQRPFFTMELLTNAQSILSAARRLPFADQVRLLGQTLQALSYLHRRGVLHRDLKPANILIDARGQAKVLDFGLAALVDRVEGAAGTLGYIAPEVFQGGKATAAADLYALGVIAFEVFSGAPFFDPNKPTTSWVNRLTTYREPEVGSLPVPEAMRAVLLRLMAAEPAARYADAHSALESLYAAAELPLPHENAPIREGFLQSARFVEREAEIRLFTNALENLLKGEGSTWLVGGESGVGKSRLVREVRAHALVRGVPTAVGQAELQNGAPFQAWQPILKVLALKAHPSAHQLGVLRAVVPDLADWSQQAAETPQPLPPSAAQDRFFMAVGALCEQHASPLLIVLEDFHQADSDSLALLGWLTRLKLPNLLIIATYRDDEAPHLAEGLPQAYPLRLVRLSEEGVRQLSSSIVGQLPPSLIQTLWRETEGNAFFLVETIRTLAEEVGYLAHVSSATMPDQLETDAVRHIVAKRLARVPAAARHMVDVAAIGGRWLNLPLLAEVGIAACEQLIERCAEFAIFEVSEGRWRFSHDKLREGVLAGLAPDQRRRLHQQVGEALERLTNADPLPPVVELAYHFAQSGDESREQRYAALAARQAADQFANSTALGYIARALALTPDDQHEARYDLLLLRESVYNLQGERSLQAVDQDALAALAEQIGSPLLQAEVAVRRTNLYEVTGRFQVARQQGETAIALAQVAHAPHLEAEARFRLGRTYRRLRQLEQSIEQLQQSVALCRQHGLAALESDALRATGFTLSEMRRYQEARTHLEAALALAIRLGHRISQGLTNIALAETLNRLGELESARRCADEGLRLCQQTGDRWGESWAYANVGVIFAVRGQLSEALAAFQQSEVLAEAAQEIGIRIMVWVAISDIYRICGALPEALSTYQKSQQLAAAHEIAVPNFIHLNIALTYADQGRADEAHAIIALIGSALTNDPLFQLVLGHVYRAAGAYQKARAAYAQCVLLAQADEARILVLEAQLSTAECSFRQGDLAQAAPIIEGLLPHWNANLIHMMEEPFCIYLAVYEMLAALKHPQSAAILAEGKALLAHYIEGLHEPALRQSLLRRRVVVALNNIVQA